MAELPRPAPSRADHSYTLGEQAALIAPLFGVEPDDLGFVIIVQTADGRCDATTNIASGSDIRGLLREAIEMMPDD